jgi:hypothetical protein
MLGGRERHADCSSLRAETLSLGRFTMNERSLSVRQAAIVATRSGNRTTWHTLRREKLEHGACVRRHDANALDGVKSLEGLLGRFGDSEIVYDPTGAFERARRLVTAARSARKQLGRRLVSLHVLENGRTIYARVRHESDLDHVAPAIGAAFARALSGADFQIMVNVGVARPPAGALAMERSGARQDQVMAAAQRLSAALAVAGAAFYGLGAQAAHAAQPSRDTANTAPSVAAASQTRTVRVIYARTGELLALHLAEEDRGGEQESARRALAAVRGFTRTDLDSACSGLANEGLRFKARRQRTPDGTAYIIAVSLEADEAATQPAPAEVVEGPVYYPINAPMPQPVTAIIPAAAAALPLPTPIANGHMRTDVAAGALVRGDQAGAIGQIDAMLDTAPGWTFGVQGALGVIDSEIAGGAQASLQKDVMANGMPMMVGAFVSGVQSTAPSEEEFGIVRVGAGVAATIRTVQLIVRGGYASGTGDLDEDGAFARAEGAWFATPDIALTGFVENDPTTGAGAGVGASFKPFSGTLANMMIDADAAWHEDGEESFRLGLRWLLGHRDESSLEEVRRRKGMSPDLMDDLRRLPDELERSAAAGTPSTQPYCGEAGTSCPAS